MPNRPTLNFADLERAAGRGEAVCIEGWISPFDTEPAPRYFALVEESTCCVGCLPRDPARRLEVFARGPIPVSGRRVRLAGRLTRLRDDLADWRYQLRDATCGDPEPGSDLAFNRRQVLKAATWACLGSAVAAPNPAHAAGAAEEQARQALEGMATVDVHSHAGGVTGLRRVGTAAGFTPVAEPMREGGMAALCLAIVSDAPTHHVTAERRIRPFRDPRPGELHEFGELAFARVFGLSRAQDMAIVRVAEDLLDARSARPAIVVAAEGGDFLEGRAERVDDAHERWALRHLQLTHYRVNELGDIQTEPPVHGGLTDFGAEVVRRCNRLGIVVDVAHGTFELVTRAAEVSTRPLVLSHTSLGERPGPHSRLISAEHARVVAGTGGVIGIWPPAGIFPDLAALAAGIARMVDVVGVDHVALGSDMRGLVGPSVFDSYRDLPRLAAALLDQGFQVPEVRKILGGNYVRVFVASVGQGAAAGVAGDRR